MWMPDKNIRAWRLNNYERLEIRVAYPNQKSEI